ncbi:MAG: hypothetical protein K2F79_05010, partial [Muribaculaceae bacterium]|nr:hypothetical protein [Muribaculaceae bacterium]
MAPGRLRNLMLMLAAACLVSWSCTRDEQLVRPDDAPGVPEPSEPQAKSGVFFSENNPTRVLAGDDGRA